MNPNASELIEDTAWQTAPPPPPPEPPFNWVPWLVVAGVVAALLLAFWWYRRRMRRYGGIVARWTIWRPNKKAMKALAALEKRVRVENDDDRFVSDVSNVVRVYLQERFELRAPQQSTEEFLRDAAGSEFLTDQHRATLETFLVDADRIKFARHDAGYDLRRSMLDTGRRFVEETDPSRLPWVGVHRAKLREAAMAA